MQLDLICVVGWYAEGELLGHTTFDEDGTIYDSGDIKLWEKDGSFGSRRKRSQMPREIQSRTRRGLNCPS